MKNIPVWEFIHRFISAERLTPLDIMIVYDFPMIVWNEKNTFPSANTRKLYQLTRFAMTSLNVMQAEPESV